MNYMTTIKEYIVENFMFGEEQQINEDTSFLESGIIDSTGILELVTFLEDTYNITIEDDEILPEKLDSLQNLVQFLEQKLDRPQN